MNIEDQYEFLKPAAKPYFSNPVIQHERARKIIDQYPGLGIKKSDLPDVPNKYPELNGTELLILSLYSPNYITTLQESLRIIRDRLSINASWKFCTDLVTQISQDYVRLRSASSYATGAYWKIVNFQTFPFMNPGEDRNLLEHEIINTNRNKALVSSELLTLLIYYPELVILLHSNIYLPGYEARVRRKEKFNSILRISSEWDGEKKLELSCYHTGWYEHFLIGATVRDV